MNNIMTKYANIYDVYFYKVYRFYMPFPSDQIMITAKPEALFSRLEDARKWATDNLDGRNYNVIFCNGENLERAK